MIRKYPDIVLLPTSPSRYPQKVKSILSLKKSALLFFCTYFLSCVTFRLSGHLLFLSFPIFCSSLIFSMYSFVCFSFDSLSFSFRFTPSWILSSVQENTTGACNGRSNFSVVPPRYGISSEILRLSALLFSLISVFSLTEFLANCKFMFVSANFPSASVTRTKQPPPSVNLLTSIFSNTPVLFSTIFWLPW